MKRALRYLRGDALRGEGVQGWVEAIELLLFALNDHVKVSLKVGLLEVLRCRQLGGGRPPAR